MQEIKEKSKSLSTYKKMIEVFIKNTKLAMYETIDDFLNDNAYIIEYEKDLIKNMSDDCAMEYFDFETLYNLRNKIMLNLELFENEGTWKVKSNIEINL
jgi:hypothetical protein